MSPTKKKVDMRITLPPRLAVCLGSDTESTPSTPSPHTPMPYESALIPDPISQQYGQLRFDEAESSTSGSKRIREDEEDRETNWTTEELDTLSTVLVHPFRPTSAPYPPGELPPPNIVDELTSQILAYAFRSSPKRDDRSWSHGWDATRKKLFDVALAESKIAHGALDEEDRKLPRQERLHRPGLRRVDSMDFLDQSTDGDNVGRTLRLSTSLQNSAKETSVLARSASTGSLPVVSNNTITVTPPSPQGKRKPARPQGQPRPSRPSLLQRGRSFTASDLEAEAAKAPELEAPIAPRLHRSSSSALKPLQAIVPPPDDEQSTLAVPFAISPAGSRSGSDWSDSDEEVPAKPRVVKRMKPVKGKIKVLMQAGAGGGLRSPFEEKAEIQF